MSTDDNKKSEDDTPIHRSNTTVELGVQRATRSTLCGILLVLLAMMLFAIMDGVNKYLATTYSFIQILWVRYLLFVAIALLVARRGAGLRATLVSTRRGLQIGRALILVAEKASFIIGFMYLPLADVHAIAAVSPLIVTLLSAPLLREHVGLDRMLPVVAGLCGVLLIIRPGMEVMSVAAVVPCVAALLWAAYQMLTRAVSRFDSVQTTLLYTGLVGAGVLTVLGPFFWTPPTGNDWFLLLLVAVLGAAAHFALIYALNIAPASAVQPFVYSLFLWAIVVGFVGFGDFPDTWTLVGGAVIVASNNFVLHRTRVNARSGTEDEF